MGSCTSRTGESRREISAHSSTVIVPLRPLGHDLHGRPIAPRDHDPHQPEAEVREHRLGQAGDLGRQAGLANEARVGRCPLTALSPVRFKFLRLERLERPPKTKRADPKGPLSKLR